MENYKNKRIKITINVDGHKLYYNARMIEVTSSHITFKDRYGQTYTFKRELVEEISPA